MILIILYIIILPCFCNLRNRRRLRTQKLQKEAQQRALLRERSNLNNFNPMDYLDIHTANIQAALYDMTTNTIVMDDNLERFKQYSLESLFGYDFSECFHNDDEFRNNIRNSARLDFSIQDNTLSDEKNARINDPRASIMSSWKNNNNNYKYLSKCFKDKGFERINGKDFIGNLTQFCENNNYNNIDDDNHDNAFGSFMDIIGIKDRCLPHAWHQDSGLNSYTVMLGFPTSSNYQGLGVFSHIVKLKERLPPPQQSAPRILDTDYFPEEVILKPIFKKGCEILVYRDSDVFHSAPDVTYRESVWRFM